MSTVSRQAIALDSELEGRRHRPLEAESYPYLFVWTPATREGQDRSRIVSEGVLIVCALREDGFREILSIEVADVEGDQPGAVFGR